MDVQHQAPGAAPALSWHSRPAVEALAAFGSADDGLSDAQVGERYLEYGRNELPAAPEVSPVVRFLRQFNNALIYFLIAAALAAAFLNHMVDASVIAAVVLVNAIVGFVQEGQAEKALDSIREMIAPHARVVRSGAQATVDARDLVPGDVVMLEAGDLVPADIRLMRGRSLLVNESILTGESVPAEKSEAPVAADAVLGDRSSMLYSGTLVAKGQGVGVVVATGRATQIGGISDLAASKGTLSTPLLIQINHFAKLFTYIAIAGSVLLFAYMTLVAGYNWVDALIVIVALAVGAIPEGLPAVITITLALGVQHMARRHAIIRHLPAVETLGATSVICSDKTGTLTKNEMTARRLITARGRYQVTGSGYAPEGALDTVRPGDADARDLLLRSLLLCNDAQLVEVEGRWTVVGDPMEGALVALAMKAGLDVPVELDVYARLDEIPFDAQHRFMATLNKSPSRGELIFVKGAPERVIAMCSAQQGAAQVAVDAAYWRDEIAAAASQGERVLAFAYRPAPAGSERLSFDDVEDGLVLLGLVGFIDPPREEAIAAVADCRTAGIAVKMITGDHGDTAAAIARQIGIAEDPKVMTGAEVAALSDAKLRTRVEEVSVFARTSPEDKLRIVRALQANGHVAAMTGDGVNDVPSLKQADVGIAMGRKGTEAAKNAAQMVLVDDNFATIVSAVRVGRAVYDNIKKVISWTMPTNGGEALFILVAIFFGLTLPLSPVQILWINLVSSVTLGLALAFEPPEPGIMQRPPRAKDAPLISRFLLWRIVFVSVLFAIGVFAVRAYALRSGMSEAGASTMVVNALMAMEVFYLFNVRYLHMTSFNLRGFLGTRAVLISIAVLAVLQAAMTYVPALQSVLGTEALSFANLVVTVFAGLVVMLILEGEKIVMRRLGVLGPQI